MQVDAPTLDALLDQMHEALKLGDLAALETLAGHLAGVEDTFALPRNPDALLRIRQKAARNDALLAASQRGLKAAQRRIAELRSLELGFSTYDDAGSKHLYPQARTGLSRRF